MLTTGTSWGPDDIADTTPGGRVDEDGDGISESQSARSDQTVTVRRRGCEGVDQTGFGSRGPGSETVRIDRGGGGGFGCRRSNRHSTTAEAHELIRANFTGRRPAESRPRAPCTVRPSGRWCWTATAPCLPAGIAAHRRAYCNGISTPLPADVQERIAHQAGLRAGRDPPWLRRRVRHGGRTRSMHLHDQVHPRIFHRRRGLHRRDARRMGPKTPRSPTGCSPAAEQSSRAPGRQHDERLTDSVAATASATGNWLNGEPFHRSTGDSTLRG